MPPKRLKREAFSELGEGDFAIAYNKRTKHPLRNAHRTLEDSPFVDSAIVLSDISESEDPDSDTIPVLPRRKRKRSPSPPASEDLQDDDDLPSDSSEAPDQPSPPTSQTAAVQIVIKNLLVNVPRGHSGPILLQLDVPPQSPQPRLRHGRATKSRFVQNAPATALHSDSIVASPAASRKPRNASTDRGYAGFLDLPAELRNEIYRHVLVAEQCLRFDSPTNFSRSGALLRTCHQAYDEARSILYSENHFVIVRKTGRHGSYWVSEWNEVGFRAARKFLKSIGPTNTGLLRHLTFFFEDAVPCLNPSMVTADDRRFVFDDVLMSVLRHLADHARLKKLDLHFRGRRRVERTDHRFLQNVTAIRADEVAFVTGPPNTFWPCESKQEKCVQTLCLEAMTRKRKLYD